MFFFLVHTPPLFFFFFFNDPATTEIYPFPLHAALPISFVLGRCVRSDAGEDMGDDGAKALGKRGGEDRRCRSGRGDDDAPAKISVHLGPGRSALDRKSTRLNSSHQIISYAVFCLKKKIA